MSTSVQNPDKMNAREIYSPSRTRNTERKQLKIVKIAIPFLQTKKMNHRAQPTKRPFLHQQMKHTKSYQIPRIYTKKKKECNQSMANMRPRKVAENEGVRH
jgi:hypothetical protein